MRPRKFATNGNTRDLVNLNKDWRVVKLVESLGETPMTGFHTWRCRCGGVGPDSGYGHKKSYLGHEKSYLMHDTEPSI